MSKSSKHVDHYCHAVGCAKGIEVDKVFCARHWRMISPDLKMALCLHFKAGACEWSRGKGSERPNKDWFNAMQDAVLLIKAGETLKLMA